MLKLCTSLNIYLFFFENMHYLTAAFFFCTTCMTIGVGNLLLTAQQFLLKTTTKTVLAPLCYISYWFYGYDIKILQLVSKLSVYKFILLKAANPLNLPVFKPYFPITNLKCSPTFNMVHYWSNTDINFCIQ